MNFAHQNNQGALNDFVQTVGVCTYCIMCIQQHLFPFHKNYYKVKIGTQQNPPVCFLHVLKQCMWEQSGRKKNVQMRTRQNKSQVKSECIQIDQVLFKALSFSEVIK